MRGAASAVPNGKRCSAFSRLFRCLAPSARMDTARSLAGKPLAGFRATPIRRSLMWHDSVCNTVQESTVTSTIVAKKTTTWGESGFSVRVSRPPRRHLQRLRKESRLPAWQDLGDPWTTWATCPRRASPRCSSPSSPNATKECPWASPPTWSTRSGNAFANPMATDAAIDRGVHRTIILEFDIPSYHTDAGQQRGQEQKVNPRVRSIGIHRQLRQVHCL